MEFGDKVEGNNTDKSLIQVLNESAIALVEQSKDIRIRIERIIESCRKNGTIGSFKKSFLLARMDNLKRLASLCDVASGKIMNASEKLSEGVPGEEVLSKISDYAVFFKE